MTRLQSNQRMWLRLFVVLILLLIVCIPIMYFAGPMRLSILVFLIGNMGGYVSAHRGLAKLSDTELEELSSTWPAFVLPPFIGGILSLVLYLLFLSNILAGEMFPRFESDPIVPIGLDSLFAHHAVGAANYAKLFFWSFVAGFNQKSVIDVVHAVQRHV